MLGRLTWEILVRKLLILTAFLPVCAQRPPSTPDRPWHSPEERRVANEGRLFHQAPFRIESDRVYSLPELIDLAESHNPETRVAWENVAPRRRLLGLARSDLYPTLSAVALPAGSRKFR
jgi:outer membrane protein TolC